MLRDIKTDKPNRIRVQLKGLFEAWPLGFWTASYRMIPNHLYGRCVGDLHRTIIGLGGKGHLASTDCRANCWEALCCLIAVHYSIFLLHQFQYGWDRQDSSCLTMFETNLFSQSFVSANTMLFDILGTFTFLQQCAEQQLATSFSFVIVHI